MLKDTFIGDSAYVCDEISLDYSYRAHEVKFSLDEDDLMCADVITYHRIE